MTYLKKLLICFIIFAKTRIRLVGGYSAPYAKDKLEAAQIIPDVIDKAPDVGIKVEYSNGVQVDFGNQITSDDMTMQPKILEWPAENNSLYTFVMTDPDVPCRKYPTQREWVHWLIANIPGNAWAEGETICNYVGPQRAVGDVRFVFLVYKQPGNKPKKYKSMKQEGSLHRLCWSVRGFAKNESLEDPIATNFFIVPEDPQEKIKERERNIRIRKNKIRPPTLTTPTNTPSYRDMFFP